MNITKRELLKGASCLVLAAGLSTADRFVKVSDEGMITLPPSTDVPEGYTVTLRNAGDRPPAILVHKSDTIEGNINLTVNRPYKSFTAKDGMWTLA